MIVLDEMLAPDGLAGVYSLREVAGTEALAHCLGQQCEDIRVWEHEDGGPSKAAREVAVSYVLSRGVELFYAIQLHDQRVLDRLLLGDEMPRDTVTRCFSVREAPSGTLVAKHRATVTDIVEALRSHELRLSTLDDLVYEPVVDPRIERELESLLTDRTPTRLPGEYGRFDVGAAPRRHASPYARDLAHYELLRSGGHLRIVDIDIG